MRVLNVDICTIREICWHIKDLVESSSIEFAVILETKAGDSYSDGYVVIKALSSKTGVAFIKVPLSISGSTF